VIFTRATNRFPGAAPFGSLEGCGLRRYSVNHQGEIRAPILFADQRQFHNASVHRCVPLAWFLSLSVILQIAPKIRIC